MSGLVLQLLQLTNLVHKKLNLIEVKVILRPFIQVSNISTIWNMSKAQGQLDW